MGKLSPREMRELGRGPRAEDVADHLMNRLRIDGTDDGAALAIVYDRSGAFRRLLGRDISGADIKALCEAVLSRSPR